MKVCEFCGKALYAGHKCQKWTIVLKRSAKKPIPGAVYVAVYDAKKKNSAPVMP